MVDRGKLASLGELIRDYRTPGRAVAEKRKPRSEREVIAALHAADPEIARTSSVIGASFALAEVLRRVPEDHLPTPDEVGEILAILRANAIEEHDVFHPVFHAVISTGSAVELGPFTILTPQEATARYAGPHGGNLELHVGRMNAPLVVRYHASARDAYRAVELADQRFAELESVLRFVARDLRMGNIGITDITPPAEVVTAALSTHRVFSRNAGGQGAPLDLSDERLYSDLHGRGRLWEIVKTTDRNRIERNIMSAVAWVAKAIVDPEPARGLAQACFALEGLLVHQNAAISLSIQATIAEGVAYIVGQDPRHRRELERRTKHMYGQRSGVVHAGASAISEDDREAAIDLPIDVIEGFLDRDDLKNVSTVDQYREWLLGQKYGLTP